MQKTCAGPTSSRSYRAFRARLRPRLGAIVVKKPNHLAFHKFTRKVSVSGDKGPKDIDIWNLVRHCIVYPEISTVEKITEEYPGVTARLGSAVIELGHGVVEDAEGK